MGLGQDEALPSDWVQRNYGLEGRANLRFSLPCLRCVVVEFLKGKADWVGLLKRRWVELPGHGAWPQCCLGTPHSDPPSHLEPRQVRSAILS